MDCLLHNLRREQIMRLNTLSAGAQERICSRNISWHLYGHNWVRQDGIVKENPPVRPHNSNVQSQHNPILINDEGYMQIDAGIFFLFVKTKLLILSNALLSRRTSGARQLLVED